MQYKRSKLQQTMSLVRNGGRVKETDYHRSVWHCLDSHQPKGRAASRQSVAAPWSQMLGM